jgi:hydrogenase/urease accessory protein HupE
MTRLPGRAFQRPVVIAAAALSLAAFASERSAFAHAVGVSSGEYRLDGRVLSGDVGMAAREVARLLPAIDTDHDGSIDAEELAAGHDAFVRVVVGGLTVEADGKACAGSLERAWALEGEGGIVVQVRYTCPEVPRRVTLAAPILESLVPGHRHLARVFRAGKAQIKVLDRAHSTWTLDEAGRPSSIAGMAWSMLALGVEHILTGYDHLIFLLGLIIVGGSLRSLVGVVSAFTLAHSITLALAATGVLAPSPRFVEPAIALSIAYVGVENLFVKDASRRWRIAFPFGLIHGFGFAGALREIGLPHAQVPVALVSFNLGVELGQLGVLALALPLVLTAHRAPRFGERGVRAVSGTIALAGVVLFVVRVVATG